MGKSSPDGKKGLKVLNESVKKLSGMDTSAASLEAVLKSFADVSKQAVALGVEYNGLSIANLMADVAKAIMSKFLAVYPAEVVPLTKLESEMRGKVEARAAELYTEKNPMERALKELAIDTQVKAIVAGAEGWGKKLGSEEELASSKGELASSI